MDDESEVKVIEEIVQLIDFGKLSSDKYFVSNVGGIHFATDKIKDILKPLCENDSYSRLSTEDKVHHDLFMAYIMTSLFWIYLKITGVDVEGHVVESELERLKEYLQRAKSIKDRKSMPHINKAAANRFVKHGLWNPNEKQQKGKRKRFEEDDDDDD